MKSGVKPPHSKKQTRWIHSSHSYKSGGALEAHFGLGKADTADLKVVLPRGTVVAFSKVKASQYLDLDLATSQDAPGETIKTVSGPTAEEARAFMQTPPFVGKNRLILPILTGHPLICYSSYHQTRDTMVFGQAARACISEKMGYLGPVKGEPVCRCARKPFADYFP